MPAMASAPLLAALLRRALPGLAVLDLALAEGGLYPWYPEAILGRVIDDQPRDRSGRHARCSRSPVISAAFEILDGAMTSRASYLVEPVDGATRRAPCRSTFQEG